MKRLCILVALILLLCGCAAPEDNVLIPEGQAPSSPAYSAAPSGEARPTDTAASELLPSQSHEPNYDENTLLYTINLLKMGTVEDNPPFSFRAEDGYFDGVDLALGKQIAIDLGKEIKITAMARDQLIPALLGGEIHMAIAALTEEQVDGIMYSTPYIEADGKRYCIAFKAGDEQFTRAVNDIIRSLIEYDDMMYIWANYSGEAVEGGDQ